MIKKRSRPQPRVREISPEAEEALNSETGETGGEEKLEWVITAFTTWITLFNGISISELLELQKLRKSGAGIDIARLNKGVIKKKPKKVVVSDEGDTEAKAKKVVRANNFTKQTNALDVDKHMWVLCPRASLSPVSPLVRMAYIEENMKLRRGEVAEGDGDDASMDPYAELFEKSKKGKEKEEGSVTNSLAMLTAIPEVDLGMEYVTFSLILRDWANCLS
jgi:hypothetical protein